MGQVSDLPITVMTGGSPKKSGTYFPVKSIRRPKLLARLVPIASISFSFKQIETSVDDGESAANPEHSDKNRRPCFTLLMVNRFRAVSS